MKYTLRKYAAWGVNKKLVRKPYSKALSYPDQAPRHKTKRRKGYASAQRKRDKRKVRKFTIDLAIKQYLKLPEHELICEHHLRECERRLKLPVIRLKLDCDVPFSTFKGRKTRVFETLRLKHPQLC
jgi:hypothetical protein